MHSLSLDTMDMNNQKVNTEGFSESMKSWAATAIPQESPAAAAISRYIALLQKTTDGLLDPHQG